VWEDGGGDPASYPIEQGIYMKLNKELLEDSQGEITSSEEFESCWNAKGLYNSMQFVLRLRPDVRNIVDNLPNGIVRSGAIGFDAVQAYSTFLHETIHWWQHCGTTFGLITSLSFPTQFHKTADDLKKYLQTTGPKKSIINYNTKFATEYQPSDDEFKIINQILNNFFDIEFFRKFTLDTQNIHKIVEHPLFENIGHSFHITYASIIGNLAATFDEEYKFLPDTSRWISEFKKLTNEKVEGYYFGSSIGLPPVSVREIFEGQARFIQIQYLHFASGGALEFRDFEDLGMLSDVYVKAFDVFLTLINSEKPKSINDPLVGLFLLICDISINPGDGFPFDIYHFESFVISTDPGTRFFLLTEAVCDKHPDVKGMIREYSASEYYYVSKLLCDEIVVHTPLQCSEKVVSWANTCVTLKAIMDEESSFAFSDLNLPIRMLFSRFIRFNEDKLKHPEFFCWTGAWAAGERCSETTFKLFSSNQALFSDKADGDIYPTKIPGKEETLVMSAFNRFYSWNVVYDLTRQWVMDSGNFTFDYYWLTSKHDQDELKKWASDHFKFVFGVSPDEFEIVK
jgi:hypothetical protein